MRIGEKLKIAREQKDLTQKQVAEHAKMQQTCYSRIERNIQEPSLEQLKAICEILNLDANILLGIKVQVNQDLVFAQKIKQIYKETYGGQ